MSAGHTWYDTQGQLTFASSPPSEPACFVVLDRQNYVKNMTRLLGQQTQDAADTAILGPLSFDLRKFAIHPVSPRDLLVSSNLTNTLQAEMRYAFSEPCLCLLYLSDHADLQGDARTKKLKTKDDDDASSRDVDVDGESRHRDYNC